MCCARIGKSRPFWPHFGPSCSLVLSSKQEFCSKMELLRGRKTGAPHPLNSLFVLPVLIKYLPCCSSNCLESNKNPPPSQIWWNNIRFKRPRKYYWRILLWWWLLDCFWQLFRLPVWVSRGCFESKLSISCIVFWESDCQKISANL